MAYDNWMKRIDDYVRWTQQAALNMREGMRRGYTAPRSVNRAEWDGGQWRLSTSAGPRTADVLVTATGFLHRPLSPGIPGLDRFGGSVFHSSRWDVAAVSAARSVAVIGTGSSGVQIVSALAGSVNGCWCSSALRSG